VVVQTLDNRADLLTGPVALVGISVHNGGRERLQVTLDGRHVTGLFARRTYGGFVGLVGQFTGLTPGVHIVRATLRGGYGARLRITDYPIGGPVFAGPQVRPWVCDTQAYGLAAPVDAQCDAPVRTAYYYKSTDSSKTSFQPYDASNPPSDVAVTTTDTGTTVPYIIRVETGVEDRGIYQLAVLANPGQPWLPWAPQAGWNRKIVWVFGGGTAPNYGQGTPSGILEDSSLGRGFMVTSSGLNVHGEDANDTVSAEAVMILKQHIADTYGPIRYVIGEGASGGGLQQYIIANTYPGLLNGLLPGASFPDLWSSVPQVFDCIALLHYFQDDSPGLWLNAQQQAEVTGYQDVSACPLLNQELGARAQAADAANCNLPQSEVYNAASNPNGTRCTLEDYEVAVWGQRGPGSWNSVERKLGHGFANRPYDTVGVQYGLEALQAGQISPAQFADLNAKIGGLDIDGNTSSQRAVADPTAIATAYLAGQVTDGHYLSTVPILDLRGWNNEDVHQTLDSYIAQARVLAANGTASNTAIWVGAVPLYGSPTWMFCGLAAFSATGTGLEPPMGDHCTPNSPMLVMDRWLNAISIDHSGRALAAKVIADKPANAIDSCWIGTEQITDEHVCQTTFPYDRDPRMEAGEGLRNDVLKCQLKPLTRIDYKVAFTDAEWAQLQEAFPSGVCNWTKSGMYQQPARAAWLTFAHGPGGRPLGPSPVSQPLAPARRTRSSPRGVRAAR
jgi:hypothetical protein